MRELVGPFVWLIDDRVGRRIAVVTDLLGVHPWFVGTHEGRLVGGSDVLGICDAGLSRGEVDIDAVSSWLCYNFVSTGGSVVRDFRRPDRGAVSWYEPSGRLLEAARYAEVRYADEQLPADQVIDGLFERVRQAFNLLTRGIGELNVPLSGGHDSRLICALATGRHDLRQRSTTVQSDDEEALAARQVATALGLDLQVIAKDRNTLDDFADPMWVRPEGLPTPRNLTNAIARMYPGIPVASGFMGDVLIRPPMNAAVREFLALDRKGLSDGELANAAHERFLIRTNRLDLLRGSLARRVTELARASLCRLMPDLRKAAAPLAFANLHLRHATYFAGIFLSHADVSDAVLPFYGWELIDFATRFVLARPADVYDQLFARHFPPLAGIPHESNLPSKRQRPMATTRHLRSWGRSTLFRGLASWQGSAMDPAKLLKRAVPALVAKRYPVETSFAYKVIAAERRLQAAGIRVDWEQLGR